MDNYVLGEYLMHLNSGDKNAFIKIYEEFKTPVFTIIFRIVKSKESAEDVTQDFFVKLYRSPPESKIINPRAWLFKAARNMAIDHLRSARSFDILDENLSYETDISVNIDIEKAILSLKREEREIVTLHLNCDLTFSEISNITGLSLPSVYRRYQKALKMLKEKLKGGYYGNV